ncbi:MAG: hypothetical protein AAF723_07265, partial [Pseudomonadota bacterium]
LTAAGKKLLSGAEKNVISAENKALSMLPKTQQGTFLKTLQAYAEALDKIEAEAMAPKRRPAAKKTAAKKTTRKTTKKAAKKTTRKTAAKKTAKKAPAKRAAKKTTKRRATKKR